MNAAGVGPSDTAATGAGAGAAPSAPVDLDEALVQCLRSQTRLNAVVKEVTYTDPATSSGNGVLYCLELKRDFPFSCKAITALKGEAAKLTTAHDRCTFKLSEKNNEIRATSIRLKNRVTSAPGSGAAATSASSGSSSIAFLQQRHEQGSLSIYDGDSPLNSLEYAPALSAPIHVMALQGPHFLSAPPYSVPQPPPPSLPLLQPSSLPLPTDTGASAALLPGGVGSTTTVTTIGTTGSFFDYPHHREDSPFSPPTAAAAATDVPASSTVKGYP